MTKTGTNITWKTSNALRYPSDTQINVMFWDDLVVGTSIGLYGQLFQLVNAFVTGDFDGDGYADPVAVTANGVWKIWMSSADYAPVSTSPLIP